MLHQGVLHTLHASSKLQDVPHLTCTAGAACCALLELLLLLRARGELCVEQ
jgi:hypothetical protein